MLARFVIGMTGSSMTKTLEKPRTKVKPKTQRPPLYKVILLNDDYTPREFVVQVLKAVFRMNADQAYRVDVQKKSSRTPFMTCLRIKHMRLPEREREGLDAVRTLMQQVPKVCRRCMGVCDRQKHIN